jgi:hypothetical protein
LLTEAPLDVFARWPGMGVLMAAAAQAAVELARKGGNLDGGKRGENYLWVLCAFSV